MIVNFFGVLKVFFCNFIKDVFCVIIKSLQGRLIYILKNDELKFIFEIYREKWGFLMCVGVIDGIYIFIIVLKEDYIDYVNRKGYYSVVMQVVVDCNYFFRDVVIGWLGSVYDVCILLNFSVYEKGNNKILFLDIRERIGD